MDQIANDDAADFGARLTAFGVDAALAAAGYALTIKLLFPSHPLFMHPKARAWAGVWTGLFLLYQAFASADGRRSAGKALAGIRVVGADGEPLSLGRSAARSALYVASSFFNIGFLWALFDSESRTWHDLAVGSRVVNDSPPSAGRVIALRAAACACLAVFSGAWYWSNVVSVRLLKSQHDQFTNTGLRELRMLEDLHFKRHGRYADSLEDLARLSPQPNAFLEDARGLFAELKITARAGGYTIVGRASDPARTRVAFTGP